MAPAEFTNNASDGVVVMEVPLCKAALKRLPVGSVRICRRKEQKTVAPSEFVNDANWTPRLRDVVPERLTPRPLEVDRPDQVSAEMFESDRPLPGLPPRDQERSPLPAAPRFTLLV